ncbi:MAG: DUF4834 domain-containing protein [Bacteroidetes bacterium]|nr:DUF4834 domain-containing protein [Bacteroidota bacterium]
MFLRILGTFIIIYVFFRIFTGIILPAILNWQLKRYKKKYYSQNPQAKESQRYRKGDVNITMDNGKEKSDSDSIGEYVDFEDIKDNEK